MKQFVLSIQMWK